MVNPVHLQTLLEVVRLGSFASAASQLGYTPSAVSQQMAALERETGVELFHRTARSIVPTEAALVMTRHAAKVLTDIDALRAATARAAEAAGRELRLGIFPSLATYVLPSVLRSERWRRLGLDLHVSVAEPGQTIRGLHDRGDLDVVLVYQVGQSGLAWPHTMDRLWVGDDPFRVVLPESWGIAEGVQVSADQLGDMPWIVHHPGTSDATVIDRLFASCGLQPRVVAYSDDFNASLGLSSAGLGAALVPELALQSRPGGVVVVDVPEIRLARTIFGLRPGGAADPQARIFLDLVAEALTGLVRHA
ncbi:LysR family transcriptional regulator [Sinomonas sp. R1AF57]|uniref:LysR family transcriptional regulator n=1 Tax=Sinomonas sp. R1AF57 TaxID=2020377 RepID=UPI000B5E07E2|nr:LysR family transcriptional regulator [Sinomonas sp. R1AF57]ASN52104.1 LysR family transcriptional regulator [Sinomonas sp. R1AF57]